MSNKAKSIIVDDDALSRKVLEQLISQTDSLDFAGAFESAIEASNFLRC